MATTKGKSTLHGRDAETGRFITIEKARRNPKMAVVERVPKRGYGTAK